MANENDFIVSGSNVYRTNYYIVKQKLGIQYNNDIDNLMISCDTYYKRNKKRDKKYEKYFKDRVNLNGKRMPSSVFARTYVN